MERCLRLIKILMKSNISPLQPESFYHIYNRGNNGENIFKASENYSYFLNKYIKFIPEVADTYAYCLLKNHFHILIKTKCELDIRENYSQKGEQTCSVAISLQFSHLFNSYAQGINKTYKRTGGLFETPFRRKEITDENYLRQLLFYIHFNAEKHGICSDFSKYPFSSYQSFLDTTPSILQREEVLNWFGDKTDFIKFHYDMRNSYDDDLIEFE